MFVKQDAHEFFGSCLTYLEEELAQIKTNVDKAGGDDTANGNEEKETKSEEDKEKEQEQIAIMDSLRICNMEFFTRLTCPTTLNFNCVVRHEFLCGSCNRSSVLNETYRELSLEVSARPDRYASNSTPLPSGRLINLPRQALLAFFCITIYWQFAESIFHGNKSSPFL